MMRTARRLAVTAMCTLLLLAGLEIAADAGTGSRAGVTAATRAGCSKARAGSRRAKVALGKPRLYGASVPGGALFTWPCTPGATRYRVVWSAAPFGKWPAGSTGWLSGSARSATFVAPAVAQPGDRMLGVAYANPVYAQLEVRNARGHVRRSATWVPVFPTAPDPGTGDALRVGTYNVMSASAGARADAVAANIAGHDLSVVALQEAATAIVQPIVSALGPEWGYVSYPGSPSALVYRKTVYRVLGSGVFNVYDAKTPGTPIATPWARFALVSGSTASRPVYVVSGHVTEDASQPVMVRKGEAGREARDMMAGINAVDTTGDPVVIAADLHYLREPYGDVAGSVEAPPTLVRGGYFSAMAAVSKVNIAFGTYNKGNGMTAPVQGVALAGVAAGPDYIMVKGFRGSAAYVNVANWSWNGVTPSDHNLVYADLVVPFR